MKKGLISMAVAAVFFIALMQLGGLENKVSAGDNNSHRVIDMRDGVVSGLERLGYTGSMSVASMTAVVDRGGLGSLVLQGCNGVTTVKTSFIRAGELISVNRSLQPDQDGGAVFQWTVAKNTTPGEYPVLVSDGVSSLILTHKVR